MYRTTALYARVSSERQAQEGTIDSQLDALRAFLAHQGWTVDPGHEFVDNGCSGAQLERPALERLRDAIALKQVQRVVVLSRDRLSRNFIHQEFLREEWGKAGCELVLVQEPAIHTPEDLLASQVRGIFAQYERFALLERTRRGRLFWARQGEPPSRAPWGYRYMAGEGPTPARWEIEPAQAEWVRTLFRWVWEEHLGLYALIRRLPERQVPPPGGGQGWQASSLSRILANPAYRGQVFYQRNQRKHSPQEAGPWAIQRPVEEWIVIPVPAILSIQEWQMTQEELARHRQLAQRHAQPRRYLLQGLLRCERCGRRLAGKACDRYLYYRCRSQREVFPHQRCRSAWIRADQLEAQVWQAVQELVLSPEQVWASYREQRQAWLQGKSQTERQALEQEAERLEQRRQRILAAYELGAVSLDELVAARKKQEQAQQDLAARQQDWEQRQQAWEGFAEALNELVKYRDTV